MTIKTTKIMTTESSVSAPQSPQSIYQSSDEMTDTYLTPYESELEIKLKSE